MHELLAATRGTTKVLVASTLPLSGDLRFSAGLLEPTGLILFRFPLGHLDWIVTTRPPTPPARAGSSPFVSHSTCSRLFSDSAMANCLPDSGRGTGPTRQPLPRGAADCRPLPSSSGRASDPR
jgi:hypothetical protein